MHWGTALERLLRDMLRDDNMLTKQRLRELSVVITGISAMERSISQQDATIVALRNEIRSLEQQLRQDGALSAQYRVMPISGEEANDG